MGLDSNLRGLIEKALSKLIESKDAVDQAEALLNRVLSIARTQDQANLYKMLQELHDQEHTPPAFEHPKCLFKPESVTINLGDTEIELECCGPLSYETDDWENIPNIFGPITYLLCNDTQFNRARSIDHKYSLPSRLKSMLSSNNVTNSSHLDDQEFIRDSDRVFVYFKIVDRGSQKKLRDKINIALGL